MLTCSFCGGPGPGLVWSALGRSHDACLEKTHNRLRAVNPDPLAWPGLLARERQPQRGQMELFG